MIGPVKNPVRIQRRRTRGWRLPAFTKCVTRPGKWGNKFTGPDAAEKHADWLQNDPEGQKLARESKLELRGWNLACFCGAGKRCHADNLLRVANS